MTTSGAREVEKIAVTSEPQPMPRERARAILYIDEYKMYSLSSQLLGGIISSYSNRISAADTKTEQQKGPLLAGQTLADAVSKQSETVERRVLFDYAYTMFEKEIERRGDLLVLSPESPTPTETAVIVKVTGKTVFNDMRATAKLLGDYNKLGEALAYIGSNDERKHLVQTLEQQIRDTKDGATKSALKQQLAIANDIKKFAALKGMQQDEKFLAHLKSILTMSYDDHFELQLSQPERSTPITFTSILNRQYLRESETSVVKKFARKAQGEFTVVGIVSQVGANKEKSDAQFAAHAEARNTSSPRAALLGMTLYIGGFEDKFLGVEENELIIDPIAVYQELAATKAENA